MDVLIIKWGNSRPEEALITDFKKCKKITLWKNNSGLTIEDALNNEKMLSSIVDDKDELVIVGYKKYCNYFGVARSQILYDYPLEYNDLKSGLKLVALDKKDIGKEWQSIRADAAESYMEIEKRGVVVGGILKFPKYSMDVYSGRSKTVLFNVQGLNSDYKVEHPDVRNNILVKFDWISADMRIASYLSEDNDLMGCYIDSDPYSHVSKVLDNKVDREQCKIYMNRAVNSLNDNDLILKVFPKLASWIKDKKRDLEKFKYVKSIMGRKFYTDNTKKGDRRAFNSILQGSIAHAMQNTISHVMESCGNIIITEQHDSLTVATPEDRLMKVINDIKNIMINPIEGVRMPLTVEVGKSWCKYKKFKEYR